MDMKVAVLPGLISPVRMIMVAVVVAVAVFMLCKSVCVFMLVFFKSR